MVKNCQMCGACGVSCNYAMDMEVLEPIQEYRIQSVKDGHTVPALDKSHRKHEEREYHGSREQPPNAGNGPKT